MLVKVEARDLLRIAALSSVKTPRIKRKAVHVKGVIGPAGILGVLLVLHLFGALVDLMVVIQKVVPQAIQIGKVATAVGMVMVQILVNFRTTEILYVGTLVLWRKYRGASQRIMVEATSTDCAQSQKTRWTSQRTAFRSFPWHLSETSRGFKTTLMNPQELRYLP